MSHISLCFCCWNREIAKLMTCKIVQVFQIVRSQGKKSMACALFGPSLCTCIGASSSRFLLHFSIRNSWDFFLTSLKTMKFLFLSIERQICILEYRKKKSKCPLDWQQRGKFPTSHTYKSVVDCWRIVYVFIQVHSGLESKSCLNQTMIHMDIFSSALSPTILWLSAYSQTLPKLKHDTAHTAHP